MDESSAGAHGFNVKFSDGTTMDAKSVVDNLHHIAQENARAAFLQGAEYEIDGYTITIKTVEPRATLLSDCNIKFNF